MNNYYRAYTMEYGTFVGLGWSVFFLLYVYGIRENNPLLLLGCMAMGVVCLLMPFGLALRLSGRVNEDGGKLTYMQGLMFSFSMFMYACLIYGIIVYGYFELFDGGELTRVLGELLGGEEMKRMYGQMGLGQQYGELTSVLGEVAGMSSFDKALMMFNNGFMIGLFMSFLVAIPASFKRVKKN